ncbi:MAG TPA: DUF488 domain-containing protein [Gaiellaceae bacterium]|nr:DUF488 domain-containing protein [Gaiellaceae bacterium]
MRVWTIGHGTRPAAELLEALAAAGVETLVDVRRFPRSRRNPQFDGAALSATLAEAGIGYVHAVELGGRRSGEPGEERFGCLREPAFRSYAARMGTDAWQEALAAALAEPAPCFLCAETLWWRCHRRFVAELLTARGDEVLHLLGPHDVQRHRLLPESDVRGGSLYVCGEMVA